MGLGLGLDLRVGGGIEHLTVLITQFFLTLFKWPLTLPSLVFNVHVAVFWCKMVSLMKRKKNTACYWKGKILVSSSSSYSSFITLHNLASTINVTEWIACSHNLHHIPLINPAPILPPISTQKRNQKFCYVIKCKIIWFAAISIKTVFL